MGEYHVKLDDVQEQFLDMYLAAYPLRDGKGKSDYPNLVINNFVNSLIARREQVKEAYRKKFGKEYEVK